MKLEVPINVDIDDVTKLIHDLQCLQTYKLGADDTMVLVSLDDVADVFADHIRAKRLDKDINVPIKEAIPVEWIEAYADWLTTIPAPFAANDERAIRAMLTKWKTNPDLQTPRCNEDTCSL